MREPPFSSFHSTRAHLTPHPESVMSHSFTPHTCLLFDVMGFILYAQYERRPGFSSPAVSGSCQATSAAVGHKSKLPPFSAHQQISQEWKKEGKKSLYI